MTLHSLLYPPQSQEDVDAPDIAEAYQSRPLNRKAFASEDTRRCPKCGEETPAEAKMCWSCFCPLPDENHQPGAGREWAKREWEKLQRETRQRERIEKVKHAVRWSLVLGASGAILSSGYFPADSMILIGLGWALIIVLWGWFRWDKHIAARQAALQGDPLERILDTILCYAGRDNASSIRFRAGVNVQVHYFIENAWQEQMAIPTHVWELLRSRLIEKTNNWKTPIRYDMHKKSFELWPEFKRDYDLPLEIVLMTLHLTS